MQQILFIQGGGAGVHDEWDDKLVASLRRELGDGYEIRYPRMPDEDEPSYAKWSEAIGREAGEMGDGATLIGHSIGGTIAIQAMAERRLTGRLDAIILVAAPFVGKGGWPGDDFEFADNLGARLPAGVPVHIFHGSADDTAPPAHADIYARVIPQAKLHRLSGRDHQLGNDLSEVAEVVRGLGK
ncbi:MAG: alpha/beta fold hydrolase [Sphingomicrobium sp.]